jgi:hypothetical protein
MEGICMASSSSMGVEALYAALYLTANAASPTLRNGAAGRVV